MSNPTTDLKTAETVYVVSRTSHRPIEHIIDHSTWGDPVYRADIEAGKIDQVVDGEWENIWTEGDNVFATEAEAEAYRDGPDAPKDADVIEVNKWQIRAALVHYFELD